MKPFKALALVLTGFLAAATLPAVGIQETLGRFGLRQIEESAAGSLSDQQTLSISTKAADIRIIRSEAPGTTSAALTGYASAPIKLQLKEGPRKTFIETKWNRSPGTHTEDLQLDVRIPEDFSGSLELLSASGAVEIPEGAWTALTADSASGSIFINEPTADRLKASSASGSITIQRATVPVIQVSTVSGKVRLNTEKSSEITTRSVSGAINLSGTFSSISVTSVSGAVLIQPNTIFEDIAASTISGTISVELPKGAETYGQISSVSGGLTLNIDGAEKQTERQSLAWNSGEALRRIEAESVSGSIRISE
ncbi:MAG: DUF4097 family beta strand repeat-containing protein [Spirochaetota bacterium]